MALAEELVKLSELGKKQSTVATFNHMVDKCREAARKGYRICTFSLPTDCIIDKEYLKELITKQNLRYYESSNKIVW